MLIASCPLLMEREIEVRGLDEKKVNFNEVVDEIQKWARKNVSEKGSPGVNIISDEKQEESTIYENQSWDIFKGFKTLYFSVSQRKNNFIEQLLHVAI